MDEIIEILREEMGLLDDEENGAPFRKSLGVEGKNKKELYKLKIDFIIKLILQRRLSCLEREFYFKKLLLSCITYHQCDDMYCLRCVLPSQKMAFLYLFEDYIEKDRWCYIITDEGIKEIDFDTIEGLFENGMETIPRKDTADYRELLTGKRNTSDLETGETR